MTRGMATGTTRVGGAVTDLTPDRELANYNGALYRPGDDGAPLQCHAVVISDDQQTIAFASCAATFIDRALLLRIRDRAARRTGIDPAHINIGATHTHAAPATGPTFITGAAGDPLYLDWFVEQTTAAIERAHANQVEANVVRGELAMPGVEMNRRSIKPDGSIVVARWDPAWRPEGPCPVTFGYIGFMSGRGEPIALIADYPCHNNACGGSGGAYHGDLFARIAEALQRRHLTLRAVAMMTGACGDIMCADRHTFTRLKGDAFVRQTAERVSDQISDALRASQPQPASAIRFASRVIEVPDRTAEESCFENDGRGNPDAVRRRYEPERRAVLARGQTVCPVEVAAMVVGDAAIITNPCELFAELGLELRRRSPAAVTLVSSLTNGYAGYVPTRAAFANGGYETLRSVYTSRLVPDAGDRIADEGWRVARQLIEPPVPAECDKP